MVAMICAVGFGGRLSPKKTPGAPMGRWVLRGSASGHADFLVGRRPDIALLVEFHIVVAAIAVTAGV